MQSPSISIIIPTLNRVTLLQEALASLRSQTFPDWEALVIDDGSNDGTEIKVISLIQQDSRIKYIKRNCQNAGAPACRNEGTKLAQGKYIIYVDSDDCLAPSALEKRFKKMEQFPELDFGIFPCILFQNQPGDMRLLWNADNNINDIDRFLAFDIPWQTMSPIWRRDALSKVGEWDERLLSWQDFEFHLRALIKNLKYKRFPEPDCFWRIQHPNSIGKKSIEPKHLKCHEQLFLDIQQMLVNAEMLTEKRKHLLCGLYFWLMNTWISKGMTTEAKKAWYLCYERGLIDRKKYLQVISYIEIASLWVPHNFLRKTLLGITKKCFKVTLPKGVVPKWSDTFHKTVIDLGVSNF